MKIGKKKQNKILKDESKLSVEYIPENILHREKQINKMDNYVFIPLIHGEREPRNTILYGVRGTGKTASVKKCLNDLQEREDVTDRFKGIYVDCSQLKSEYQVITHLVSELNPEVTPPSLKGKTKRELYEMIKDRIKEDNLKALIVLDEVDEAVDSDSELIKQLHKIKETDLSFTEGEERQGNLALMVITNSARFQEKYLQGIEDRVRVKSIQFEPYNADELKEILEERVDKAFYPDVVTEGALSFISAKGSQAGNGSCRYCINLLREAGETAELNNREKVTDEVAKESQKELEVNNLYKALRNLSKHKLIVAYSILTEKEERNKPLTTSQIFEVYKNYCKEFNYEDKTKRWVREYINELESLDAVSTWLGGKKGSRGSFMKVDIATELETYKIAVKKAINNQNLFS